MGNTDIRVEQVIVEMLGKNLDAVPELAIAPFIDEQQLTGKERVLVRGTDSGDDLRVKQAGVYARAIEVSVLLKMPEEFGADHMTLRAKQVEDALDNDPGPLETTSGFLYLRINERTGGAPRIDTHHWLKEFTLEVTALLA